MLATTDGKDDFKDQSPDIDYAVLASFMDRSHDPFHRAIGKALDVGTVAQRRALEGAFPNLFSTLRIAIEAENEARTAHERVTAEYQASLASAGLKIDNFGWRAFEKLEG